MKLRNKKTGEIVDDGYVRETHDFQFDGQKHVLAVFKGNGHRPPERVSGAYNSLAELNEEWEDAPEEPKDYWWISPVDTDVVHCVEDAKDEMDKYNKEIGNYFETKEEAEKAVEKLKAIQRLKNYYLKFKLDFVKNKIDFTYRLDGTLHSSVDEERIIFEDMNLLFGGEE
jgi:hypothetical protein